MVEAAHDEDRQRDIGGAERARDHVGGRRHLADVELEVAHHAAERLDDRRHLDEVGIDALDRDASILDGLGMAIAADRNLQPRPVGSGRQLAALLLYIHDRTSSFIIS